MSKHTPGPWSIGYKDGSGKEYITNTDTLIATVSWGCGCCKDDEPSEQELVNAERIVACVNACEGIEDPSLVSEIIFLAKKIANIRMHKDWYSDLDVLASLIARAKVQK
jgi:hypothetical protein